MLRKTTALSLLLCSCVTSAATGANRPLVFTKSATLTRLADSLTYPARVESDVNARILAESEGVVLKILAPLGSKVARGGPIAVLKNIDSGYTYAPMTIVSAVAGVVSQVKVTVGSQVSRGQEIAVVTDPTQVKLSLEISAPDVGLLAPGSAGEFTAAGLDGSVPVQLIGVSPLIDPATGTATAELRLLTPTKATTDTKRKDHKTLPPLAPGQLGQVRFDVNQRKGFLLPDHAIHYKGENTFARVVIEGKTKLVPIRLGRKNRGQVEILAGLKEGDVVIERASSYVGEGVDVQVQKPEAGQDSSSENQTGTGTTES